MIRAVRKYYLLFIFMICISFWALVKNVGLPESPSQAVIHSNFHAQRVVAEQLNNLEGELASQQLQSSILLNKIKAKFLNKGEDSKTQDNKEQNQNLEKSINDIKDKENLDEIRKELEQEAPQGEVKSEGEKLGKENEGENKEVIDEDPHGQHPNNNKINDRDNDIEEEVNKADVIAVLVFVCNRPTINRCLDSLFKYRPSSSKFPIIVSQDCGSHPATSAVLESYGDRITRIMQPDLSEITVPIKEQKLKGYYKISRHYGWALNYTFNYLNYSNVLVVEDDLEVATDFFEYFSATLPILKNDPSLWCVSAWNDNGKPKRINENAPELLHRTDFFPGLGWMLTKTLWTELQVKWPKSYWDDWMREPAQRKDRACIRPEISRTSTFGRNGVSHGTYYQNHLRFIKLNDQFVPFTSMDLSYLTKDKYDVEFVRRVYSSQVVNSVKELQDVIKSGVPSTSEFRITYRTREGFTLLAKKLDIMEDLRAGVPRTAYRGVVTFIFDKQKVYLAPGANWLGY